MADAIEGIQCILHVVHTYLEISDWENGMNLGPIGQIWLHNSVENMICSRVREEVTLILDMCTKIEDENDFR